MKKEFERVCGICGKEETEDNRILKGEYGGTVCKICIVSTYELLTRKKIVGTGIVANIKDKLDSKMNPEIKEDKNLEFIKDLESKIDFPPILKAKLDEYIIGNEETKTILSVLIYNHYKKNIQKLKKIGFKEYSKSNTVLIGSTGTGKTLAAQTISKILDVPFAIADATSMTEAGYAGDDVNIMLKKLLENANGDVTKAENGIVFIDEVDKIASRGSSNNGRDVSGEGVQQALLKIIEGSSILISSVNERSEKIEVMLNTENILFICGGSFAGIEEIINSRINKNGKVGFLSKSRTEEKTHEILKKVQMEDIKEFGIIPELIGRLHIVSVLDELTEETYKKILTEPKNSIIKEYNEFYKSEGIILNFSKEAISHIVEYAINKKVGVRGLKSSIENIMMDVNFNIEQYKGKSVNIGKREIQKYLKKISNK